MCKDCAEKVTFRILNERFQHVSPVWAWGNPPSLLIPVLPTFYSIF